MNFIQDEARGRRGSFSQYDMAAIAPALETMRADEIYLEIGVQYGRSLEFARRHSTGLIYGIDLDQLKPLVPNTTFIKGDANNVKWDKPIKVLFIDGDHSAEGVRKDWDKYSKFVVPGGIVFFHDADDTSPGVQSLAEELRAHFYRTPDHKTSMASVQL